MSLNPIDDIVNQVIVDYSKSIDQYTSILSNIMEIAWIPKQILVKLTACVEHIQNKDTQASLDVLEEISSIIESLNSKINSSIQNIKDGVISGGN
jgi:uncharacterized protein (UPF0147 family)